MQLALSSWTFHDALYKGTLGLEALPAAASALGFEAVELQDMFLWPRGQVLRRGLARLYRLVSPAPTPRDYSPPALNRLRSALSASRVRLTAWDLDTDFSSAPDRALAYARLGLRAARRLGSRIVRITAGPSAPPLSVDRAPLVPTLQRLGDHARSLGLRLALENHLDALGDPVELAEVVRAVGRPELGVCLDFGNFAPGQEIRGVRILAPLAIHAHAKCWDFDERGEETRLDYRETLAVLKASGFDGTIAIEYEGNGDPAASAGKARRLIERHW